MTDRREYKMTPEEFAELVEASKPVPYMVIGGVVPRSPQENANAAWARLGKKLGFDFKTVQPVKGKGQEYFTAIPLPAPTPNPDAEETQDG